MKPCILRRLLPAVIFLALLAPVIGSPRAAMAYDSDLEHDARWEGYANRVVVLENSSAKYYILLVFLTGVAAVVMFKDAKRAPEDL